MAVQSSTSVGRVAVRTVSVGSVSYLNAKPLIYGLDQADDLRLILDVPSRLLDGLRQHRMDVALLPVIDYQGLEGLRVVPAGGIGCDGPTLTVRIFSRMPIPQIKTLACDTDSHTSVALARVLLAERSGIRPRFVDWSGASGAEASCDALLLIGDKVVCEEPRGYEHQLDLGAAWKELTGLPFVFAVWMARPGVDLGDLPGRLVRARESGLAHVDEIIARCAVPRGWPANVARQYLCGYLKYEIGERQLEAMRLFYQLAGQHGVIEGRLRELRMY
jgi:chorismate dehydratase